MFKFEKVEFNNYDIAKEQRQNVIWQNYAMYMLIHAVKNNQNLI